MRKQIDFAVHVVTMSAYDTLLGAGAYTSKTLTEYLKKVHPEDGWELISANFAERIEREAANGIEIVIAMGRYEDAVEINPYLQHLTGADYTESVLADAPSKRRGRPPKKEEVVVPA